MMLQRSTPAGKSGRKRKYTPYPMQELRRKVDSWALKLRVNPRLIRIQEMPRKWGSCSSGGTVTLARDLCERDGLFQDYVIVHELLHLRYPAHGRMFKVLMTMHVPRWREIDAQR